jgi:hypothetical protein
VVDLRHRSVVAHEARGPAGEGAGAVPGQVHEGNRCRFAQTCRVKAIKTGAALRMLDTDPVRGIDAHRPRRAIVRHLQGWLLAWPAA